MSYIGGEEQIVQKNQSPTTTTTTTTTVAAAAANMRLAFCSGGTAVYKPMMPPDHNTFQQQQEERQVVSGGVGFDVGGFNINVEPMKRKRGRPRKYSPPDGSLTPPPNHHQDQQQSPVINPSTGFQSPAPPPPESGEKKARGRPPGSGRKNQLAPHGSAGVGFTPHVITVMTGEDVLSKIMCFLQNGTKAVCILSANGAVSNVTLRQPATSGGTVTYEGRFEILSLSGSFVISESDGQRSRTGGLSISLAGPDGRVMGGGLAGLLIAASSVQVIVGSFTAQDRKAIKFGGQPEILSAPPKPAQRASASGSSPSRGTLSESSGGPVSPPNQSTGAFNNSNPHGMPNISWI